MGAIVSRFVAALYGWAAVEHALGVTEGAMLASGEGSVRVPKARDVQARFSCQETPKESLTHPKRRLKPWSSSAISTAPPSLSRS